MRRVRSPFRVGVLLYPHCVGGVEHFLERLLTALSQHHGHKFRFHLLASAPGPTARFFRDAGYEVATMTKLGDPIEQVADWLKRTAIDVAMSTSYQPLGALACARVRVPHVWRFGGLFQVAEPTYADQVGTMLSLIAMLSTRIVVNSQTVAAQFSGLGDAVTVIPNGLPFPSARRAAPARDLRAEAGWPQTAPLVAMIGHLVPVKRHSDFIRAAAIVRRANARCRFLVFGDLFAGPAADHAYFEQLRALRGAKGLARSLRFVRDMTDLSGVLPQLDVVAHSCAMEGMSNAVIEAMACGLPVVAADGGGCRELIADGRTGLLVPPQRPALLAARIVELLADPERGRAMGARAKRMVRRRFDLRECALRYAEVLEDVARTRC